MSRPKIINDPDTCADEMLLGLEAAFPGNRVLRDARTLVHVKGAGEGGLPTVGLVSGGGAGHEPFCAGYVGPGMLAAAVSGSVFASPPATHVVRALKYTARQHSGGVLLVIPNYTGDCLNFGLAAEWAKRDGVEVESVIVADDCALVGSDRSSAAGRRGMCGLVFVYKIAGQLAAEGAPLRIVAETARQVNRNIATMGIATGSCTLPGASAPLFTLDPETVELGLGVHGEAGTRRMKIAPASVLMSEILKPIVETLQLQKGSEVAVLINNLGGLSNLELWGVTGTVRSQLESKGVIVKRLYAGALMTALEMAGVQVCVLNLSGKDATEEDWLRLLDASTSAPAWPGSPLSRPMDGLPREPQDSSTVSDVETLKVSGPKLSDAVVLAVREAIKSAADALIANMDRLNELDSGCGDGDCGSTLARLAKGVLSELPHLHIETPESLLSQLANMSSTLMGGTSGAVYGLLFSGASKEMGDVCHDTLSSVSKSWQSGLHSIMQYSRARPGDRTLLDALVPACEEFERLIKDGEDGIASLGGAVAAAVTGCDSTASLSARVGRASYVSNEHVKDVDAGAYGVVVWMEGFYTALKKHT